MLSTIDKANKMSKEWAELAYHVTEKIKEHDACITEIEKQQVEFKIDLAVLKAKVVIFATLIPIALGAIGWGLKTLVSHLIGA